MPRPPHCTPSLRLLTARCAGLGAAWSGPGRLRQPVRMRTRSRAASAFSSSMVERSSLRHSCSSSTCSARRGKRVRTATSDRAPWTSRGARSLQTRDRAKDWHPARISDRLFIGLRRGDAPHATHTPSSDPGRRVELVRIAAVHEPAALVANPVPDIRSPTDVGSGLDLYFNLRGATSPGTKGSQ